MRKLTNLIALFFARDDTGYVVQSSHLDFTRYPVRAMDDSSYCI